jgi:hypothetical protein
MKLFLCGLLALARAAALEADPEPVALFSEFESNASPAVVDSLRSELDAIMQPVGYRFEWHSLKDADGRQSFRDLVVVSFKGDCTVARSAAPPADSGALGWTHRSGSDLLPFTGVDCTRIQRMLGASLAAADSDDRDAMLGRALGRVLAHELYHILGKTSRHGSWGIAKAFYSVRELTAVKLRFEEPESKLLRNRHSGIAPKAFVKRSGR